jgi:hypothetical protein
MSAGKRHTGEPGGAPKGDGIAETIILIWAMGIFYHFYSSQVFFELVAQIVQSRP